MLRCLLILAGAWGTVVTGMSRGAAVPRGADDATVRREVETAATMTTTSPQRKEREGIPSAAEQAAAVKDAVTVLRESKDTAKWAQAATAITGTSIGAGWEELRGFLIKPEVIASLSVTKTGMGDEDPSLKRALPEFTTILQSIAYSGLGEDTLLWLMTQAPYDADAAFKAPMVLLDALQYVPQPSPRLLAECTTKFEKTTSQTLRRLLMNALAAWGTKESLELYKKYEPWYGNLTQLIRHRDRLETIKLLVERLRAMDQPGTLIGQLCGDTFTDGGDIVRLPPFTTYVQHIGAIADVLEDFRKNPGKAKLTARDEEMLVKKVAALREVDPRK